MNRTAAIFASGVGQLSRYRVIIVSVGLAILYPLLVAFLASKIPPPSEGGPPPVEAAMGIIFMVIPMAATLATGFIVILGSCLLPEEISAGRAGFWAAQPVSRNGFFAGMTLASLFLCLLITIVLFHGTALLVGSTLSYTPASLPAAILAPLMWTVVNLSLVTLFSLLTPRIASIIICLAIAGMANFLGGMGQVADALPAGAAQTVFRTASLVSFLVFPADPLLRLSMYGMKPLNAASEQFMAFVGVGGMPPVWQVAYAAVWSGVVVLLSALRFRRMDLV